MLFPPGYPVSKRIFDLVAVLLGLTSAAFGWILASMIGALVFLCCLAAIFVVGVISWWTSGAEE